MMDLTPLEVRKKKGDFRRQIRGYDPDSVDDFLDLVADRLEQVVRENLALAERAGTLEEQVSDYREREKAMTEALVSAQVIRQEMQAKAARDADQARVEAAKDAQQERSQAALEADRARREARETLEKAQAQAAAELERSRAEVRAEVERIRAQLEAARAREEQAIQRLQARRAELLLTYRELLEHELQGVEGVARTVEEWEGVDESAEEPTEWPDLPSAAFATALSTRQPSPAPREAPIEASAPAPPEPAAEDEAEILLEEPAAPEAEELILDDEPESVIAEAAPADDDDLILEDVDDDDTWLSALVDEAGPPSAKPEAPPPARATAAAPTSDVSDEDFIDGIIAEAGVSPLMGGATPPQPVARQQDEEPLPNAAELLLGDLDEDEPTPAARQEEPPVQPKLAAVTAEVTDPLDDDADFDALFDEGEDEVGDFDFDAALSNATGLSGPRDDDFGKNQDSEAVFDLGVELDGGISPLDFGRGGPGPIGLDSFGNEKKKPSLTLRPLSPEEEAPDLPLDENRRDDDDDDDMFSSMFRGRS